MRRETRDPNTKRLFFETLGLSNEQIEKYGICLYHGLRFDAINRLESIFQTGSILPGKKINREFTSYDGTEKYLYINDDSDENCNMGKYVSVMPEEDDLEFRVFVREHLFFVIKGSIEAIQTTHVSYDEYCEIKDKSDKYYSYAFNEYFVPEGISLKDVVYIGIDSRCFREDYEKTIKDIINLMKVYRIEIPFKDFSINEEIFCYKCEENNKKRVKKIKETNH